MTASGVEEHQGHVDAAFSSIFVHSSDTGDLGIVMPKFWQSMLRVFIIAPHIAHAVLSTIRQCGAPNTTTINGRRTSDRFLYMLRKLVVHLNPKP